MTDKKEEMMFELMGCAIDVPPQQMNAVVRTESSGHQFAVGVVGHWLNRQPNSQTEAINLVNQLKNKKINYSVGLAQVNQSNFAHYGLNMNNMFDKCTNLRAGSKILKACYAQYKDWEKAYSCYYSGNAVTGFRHGYVRKVKRNLNIKQLTEVSPNEYSAKPIVIKARKKRKIVAVSVAQPKKTMTLVERRFASSLNLFN